MLMLKSHFRINSLGHLVVGGADAVKLAKRFGTPLYVVDEQRVRENYRRFYKAFSDRWPSVLVYYALKANSNLAVVKVLQEEGAGADVSSENEFRIALKTGIPSDRMVFNGNYKTPLELKLSISYNVMINIDSFQELGMVNKIASRLKKRAQISFRVNPDVKTPTHPYLATGLRESKFGFDVRSGQAFEAYKLAANMDNIEVVGIHAHIGSQILDSAPFEEEAEKLMKLVVELQEKLGVSISIVNLGGGIGIPYKPKERELPPECVAEQVARVLRQIVKKKGLSEPTLVLEPGRYVVGDASVLLAQVGYIKERRGMPAWIGVNAGMNALIRPALYDAYHHIELANKIRKKNKALFNIAGPLCESGDFLGKCRKLPEAKQGDLAVIFDVGAYGLAMSNQYTAQPRPAMVLVKNGRAEVVRRRETFHDLTRLDHIPEWLR